ARVERHDELDVRVGEELTGERGAEPVRRPGDQDALRHKVRRQSMAAPVHLQPTAELAPRALLPGDPGRALLLAQTLLDQPRMFNHNRGLWGYTGAAADGAPLTIQSTGMGGPSAAVVAEELADLGVKRILRVGTCGALVEG